MRSNGKKLAASAAVLAAVGAFVSFGAFSAFSGSAENQSNLGTAKIDLTGVPTTGTLLVNLSNLIPGDLITKCVAVTNSSDVDTSIALTKVTDGDADLLGGLIASVEEGTVSGGSATADCANFAAISGGTYRMGSTVIDATNVNAFTGGVAPTSLSMETFNAAAWAQGATKYFKFRIALPPTVSSLLENKDSTLKFVFTATSSRAPNTGL